MSYAGCLCPQGSERPGNRTERGRGATPDRCVSREPVCVVTSCVRSRVADRAAIFRTSPVAVGAGRFPQRADSRWSVEDGCRDWAGCAPERTGFGGAETVGNPSFQPRARALRLSQRTCRPGRRLQHQSHPADWQLENRVGASEARSPGEGSLSRCPTYDMHQNARRRRALVRSRHHHGMVSVNNRPNGQTLRPHRRCRAAISRGGLGQDRT